MKKLIAVAASLATLSLGALAQDKPCSKADAGRAEKAVDRVGNFAQMQKAFKDFRQCDTGPVSDLFTESFVRLLVDWKDVDGAVAATRDADFKTFMDKHLKDPTAKDDLQTIYSRAKTKCPSKHEAFCAELAEIVKAANK
jgi:hypothetical protein